MITSLKALDEGYSSKNYVRKFLRALHPKWRAKVTAIEESKDLTSLSLDVLIGNLKVHEMIIKKDSEIGKAKVERKSLALKAKKESSDEDCLTLECPKPPRDKNQIAFVGGSWSNSGEENDEKIQDETCLVAQAPNEICLGVDLEPDEWIKDSGCSKHMTGNRKLFSTYKAYNVDNVEHVDNLGFNLLSIGKICDNKCRVTFSEHDSEITKDGKIIGRVRNLPKLKFDQKFCDACKMGKQAHASHRAKNVVSTTRCLELLHMDLFSPSTIRSYGGNRYTLVIVDDYSRPDIMFSVYLCARFQEAPKTSHLEAVKRIFRYIKGTTHLELWYPKGTGIETVVYADSDHAGDYVDRKSTSGIRTFVGWCLTSWFSKKQAALAISTTKAEYVSARKACQQALWMIQALIDYDVRLDDVPIMCDNKGAIDLSKNPVQHSRTKHIEIRHHFLRDNVQKGHISIEKVSSVDNITDILTKPFKRESFNYLRLGLAMMEHIS
nr:copia protein [Tanacetum cinerariifolium]